MSASIMKKQLPKWLITFILPLSIGLIPANAAFTEEIKLYFVVTVFMILIMAFELLPMLVTALLMPTSYVLSGLVEPSVAFSTYTGTTIWMILGALVLAAVLDECGLLKRIAYFSVKKCGNSFTGILFGVFLTGLALSIITFGQAYIIMVVLSFGICKALDLSIGQKSILLCFTGCMAASDVCILFYNPSYMALTETGIQAIDAAYSMPWFEMIKYNGIIFIFYLLIIFIFSKFYKVDSLDSACGKAFFENKYRELGAMSKKEKKALVAVALLILYLVTGEFTKLPVAYGFMVIPYLLFVPGIGVANAESCKRINYPIVFFIAGCLAIGAVGSAVGIGEFLVTTVVPLLEGQSALLTLVIMLVFGMVANIFMTPYAMLAGLAIPYAHIAAALGINPVAGVMVLIISTNLIIFPHEVAATLLMYNYGYIPMGDFVKCQTIKSVALILFFIAIVYPIWSFFGLS